MFEEPFFLLSHHKWDGVSVGWFWLVWIRHPLFPEFLSFGSTAEYKDQLHWHLSWASQWRSAQSRASFLSISVLQNATTEHIKQPVVLLGAFWLPSLRPASRHHGDCLLLPCLLLHHSCTGFAPRHFWARHKIHLCGQTQVLLCSQCREQLEAQVTKRGISADCGVCGVGQHLYRRGGLRHFCDFKKLSKEKRDAHIKNSGMSCEKTLELGRSLSVWVAPSPFFFSVERTRWPRALTWSDCQSLTISGFL